LINFYWNLRDISLVQDEEWGEEDLDDDWEKE